MKMFPVSRVYTGEGNPTNTFLTRRKALKAWLDRKRVKDDLAGAVKANIQTTHFSLVL